jgi:osmotically-inducible protein OsmY
MGNTSLTNRSSDVLVTGKRASAVADRCATDLFANSFKVVTERGTTYLMGRVTQREADRGTAVVRSTPGVQKVVRILDIISEEELARMLPTPSKPAPAGAKPASN